MIVFGKRVSIRGGKLLFASVCPACGQAREQAIVFQSYAHVFWIPFFALRKEVAVRCQHCKKLTDEKELTPAQCANIGDLKKEFRTPVWMFAGLMIVAALIGRAEWETRRTHEATLGAIATPKIGDIFLFQGKDEEGRTRFRAGMLTDMREEGLRFKMSNYELRDSVAIESKLSEALRKHSDFFSPSETDVPRANVNSENVRYVLRNE